MAVQRAVSAPAALRLADLAVVSAPSEETTHVIEVQAMDGSCLLRIAWTRYTGCSVWDGRGAELARYPEMDDCYAALKRYRTEREETNRSESR
jgi:hypothetical protein